MSDRIIMLGRGPLSMRLPMTLHATITLVSAITTTTQNVWRGARRRGGMRPEEREFQSHTVRPPICPAVRHRTTKYRCCDLVWFITVLEHRTVVYIVYSTVQYPVVLLVL